MQVELSFDVTAEGKMVVVALQQGSAPWQICVCASVFMRVYIACSVYIHLFIKMYIYVYMNIYKHM